MTTHQSSLTREKNILPTSQALNHYLSKRIKSRLVSEKFKKIIYERSALSKKQSLSLRKKNDLNKIINDEKFTASTAASLPSGAAFERPDKEPINTSTTPFLSVENLIEKNMNVLSQGRSHEYAEELNRLIKKITLSFTAKKNESQFVIKHGLFDDSSFNIITDDKNISLRVNHASVLAEHILRQHENILKDRLRLQEINLHSITFSS